MKIYASNLKKKNDEEKMKKKIISDCCSKKFEFFFFDWLVFLSFSNKNKVKKKRLT